MPTTSDNSTNIGMDAKHGPSKLHVEDVFVFVGLESLGTLAITGNLCLIAVLVRNRYLHRASFILMLSLAIADVVHGVVTTTFFYPPILLGHLAMAPTGVRIFNVLDWTAWSITLTHMSAICLDRLTAIIFYTQYSQLITVRRTKFFTTACWTFFALLNLAYILGGFCCLITPLSSNHYYTFGYGEFEASAGRGGLFSNWFDANIFTYTYTPLELAAIGLLTVCNPTTLLQLYRRHKRKMALKMASAMLLEMSMRMGSKAIVGDVREIAARRANRQQQRILLQVVHVRGLCRSVHSYILGGYCVAPMEIHWLLLIMHVQISVVTSMFYAYMAAYYLVYHVFEINNKWVVLANSIFYSVTHMMNPAIYFSLNKEMRAQLRQAITDFLRHVCRGGTRGDFKRGGSEFGNGSLATRGRSAAAGGDRRPCTGSGTSAMLDSSGGGGGARRSRDSTPSSVILCNSQVNVRNHNNRLGSEISYRSPTSIPTSAGRNLGHSESSPLLTRNDKRLRPSRNNSEVAIDKDETRASNDSDFHLPPSMATATFDTLGASKSVQAVHSLSSQSFMRSGSGRLAKSHEMRSCMSQLMPTNMECTHSSSSTSATCRLMDLEMMAMSSSVETASSLLAATSVNESISHRQELSLSSRLREMAKSFLEADELALARTAEQRNALLDELIGELNRLRLTGDQASIEYEPPNFSSSPDSTVDGGGAGYDESTALPVPRKYSRSFDPQYSYCVRRRSMPKSDCGQHPKETGSGSCALQHATANRQTQVDLIRQFRSLDRDVMQPSHMAATGRALRQSLAMLLERKRRGEFGDTSEIVVEENGDDKSSPKGSNEDEEEVYFL